MSDTTQYPDGPYLFTGKDQFGWPHKDRIALLDNGTLQFVGADWFCGLRHCDIEEFIPLVPSTELDAACQRIAALEAEVERLQAEQWTPVADIRKLCDGMRAYLNRVDTWHGYAEPLATVMRWLDSQPQMPQPDWRDCPDYATHHAFRPDGRGYWVRLPEQKYASLRRPVTAEDVDWWDEECDESGLTLPIGIDWRTTLQRKEDA